MTSDDVVAYENFVSAVSNGNWFKVLRMYKDKRDLRMAKITQIGDTVLHMAMSSGKKHVAERMVDLVCGERKNELDEESPLLSSEDEQDDELKLVFGAENVKGNTPLHLAASIGNVEICKKIGGKYRSLISRRNCVGETPIFMAALSGQRKAFLWLYYEYIGSDGVLTTDFFHCMRRDDGDTILHCAIAKGHIDVAIEIVYLYKDHQIEMAHMRNKNGLSPLHALAVTPIAFESTDLSYRSFIVQVLYHRFCSVKKKDQATTREELEQHGQEPCIWALAHLLYHKCVLNRDKGLPYWVAIIWNLIAYSLWFLALFLLLPLLTLEKLCFLAGNWIHRLRKMKEKHTWSLQIMEELLHHASFKDVSSNPNEEDNEPEYKIDDTPLMIAVKNGVIEMVGKILEKFPSDAMNVENDEGKNIVLLAAEKRQTRLYQFLCESKILDKGVFCQVDKDGNTALHLAAKLGLNLNMQTITMVEEFKWFEFVKSSVPSELLEIQNNDGKTAEEVFRDNYKEQMSSDREWLNQSSQAFSVVSTLVAGIAFSNVANNFDEKNYSSLVALSLSLTSTISFLAILASRSQSLHFWKYVPFMLHIAILTMLSSILFLWISLMLHDHSISPFIILGSPIALITIVSLPIFIGPTLMSMFTLSMRTKVPVPNRKATSAIRYRRTKSFNPRS